MSALLPAVGAFAYLGVAPETLSRLPAGSGLYHLGAFQAYRSGSAGSIELWQLEGVVTYPSFHVCLALVQGYALRGIRIVAWPNYAWSAVVVLSTVPIGGHYVVDLVAGSALWSAVAAISAAIAGTHPEAAEREVAAQLAPSRVPA